MAANDPIRSGERPPRTAAESLRANLRWQPAIPAVFVFIVGVLFPVAFAPAGDPGFLVTVVLPVGIVASCGLAVAAGFCSLFPQLAWLALAVFSLSRLQAAAVPGYVTLLLGAGIAAVLVMVFVQLWRIRTARFVPTIRDGDGDDDS